MLSGGQTDRKLDYDQAYLASKLGEAFQTEIADEHWGEKVKELCMKEQVGLIYDLDQNLGFSHLAVNGALSCLISHGKNYRVLCERGLLGVEFLIDQGWPIPAALPGG